jgi:hypothetical protein
MEPLLSIQIYHQPPVYHPGDVMRCDYQIDAVERDALIAVEVSVVWVTEGKGDEDLGIHFFERRVPSDAEEADLRPLRVIETPLPNSPLTYHGNLLQIRWRVRLRAFLKNGREYVAEKPFILTASDKSRGN